MGRTRHRRCCLACSGALRPPVLLCANCASTVG
jgi:hypothetical protein